jgi:hypothetical protein
MNAISLAACAAVFLTAAAGAVTSMAAENDSSPDLAWPAITSVQKPWTRWWWLGSAVDKPNLTRELQAIHDAGIGGVEITPIYGATGYEDRYIDFLSPKFMEMLRYAGEEGKRLDLGVDMATGTGWPFGGPWITPADADATVARDGDQFVSRPTRMKVKRAAPGDEGWVANPYSIHAIESYLDPFTKAFNGFPSGLIGTQFHDSFEYSGNWTDALPGKFKQMHGYDLADHVKELFGEGDKDTVARVKSDYRETLAAMHMEYGEGWVKWSHDHGFRTREQAHGAPANLLDLYASADIPETETFGSSVFPIPGFRADPNPGHGKPEPMISRIASSAGHVAGRPLISSETFTWLREHFNVALSQCKPEADQVWLAGINHIYFHGSCYSPDDVQWPGWLFYASTEFNPRNTIWRDLPAMNAYIARVQSILQGGQPDNDVLVYWPIYDLWNDATGMEKRFAMSPSKWANDSAGGKTAKELIDHGYNFDFISDAQLLATKVSDGQLKTSAGSAYRALVVPPCDRMPVETLHQISALADAGATVVFQSHLPVDVPGLGELESNRARFKADLSRLGTQDKSNVTVNDSPTAALAVQQVRREAIADSGVGFIRRRSDAAHDYFFANLTAKALDSWVKLGSACQSAVILDPVTGRGGVAAVRKGGDAVEVYLQLRPGESQVLRCFDTRTAEGPAWARLTAAAAPVPTTVVGPWHVDFIDGGPAIPASFTTDKLASWTTLGDDEAKRFAGTARYHAEFDLPASPQADDWRLDLGDVRESARVRINGWDAGTVWCIPYTLDNVGRFLRPGERNVLELEVTNLAANRVRDLDRRGVKWKAFHEINYVDIHYKPFDASKWELVDSGLIGPVTITPMRREMPK